MSQPSPLAAAPRLALTDDELDAWDRDGFHLHPEPLFAAQELAALRAAGQRVEQRDYATGAAPDERFWEPGAPAGAVCKLDNAWKSDPLIARAATSPRVGAIAAQLIGAHGMRLWQDQYLRKPGRGGGIVAWHQDWMYWQAIDRPRTVTCWIALDDVTLDQGPMLFVAGSHQPGLHMEAMPTDWTGDHLPPAPLPGARTVPAVMRAGQVSFHHANLLHGSDCNRGPRDRLSLVAHLVASDCCLRHGVQDHVSLRHMRAAGGGPGDGERVRGPQFPWAWRAG